MPSQPVEVSAAAGISAVPQPIYMLDELWRESGAASYGLEREQFREILERIGTAQNFGLAPDATASRQQQVNYFRGLRLADLVLARE